MTHLFELRDIASSINMREDENSKIENEVKQEEEVYNINEVSIDISRRRETFADEAARQTRESEEEALKDAATRKKLLNDLEK